MIKVFPAINQKVFPLVCVKLLFRIWRSLCMRQLTMSVFQTAVRGMATASAVPVNNACRVFHCRKSIKNAVRVWSFSCWIFKKFIFCCRKKNSKEVILGAFFIPSNQLSSFLPELQNNFVGEHTQDIRPELPNQPQYVRSCGIPKLLQ